MNAAAAHGYLVSKFCATYEKAHARRRFPEFHPVVEMFKLSSIFFECSVPRDLATVTTMTTPQLRLKDELQSRFLVGIPDIFATEDDSSQVRLATSPPQEHIIQAERPSLLFR